MMSLIRDFVNLNNNNIKYFKNIWLVFLILIDRIKFTTSKDSEV